MNGRRLWVGVRLAGWLPVPLRAGSVLLPLCDGLAVAVLDAGDWALRGSGKSRWLGLSSVTASGVSTSARASSAAAAASVLGSGESPPTTLRESTPPTMDDHESVCSSGGRFCGAPDVADMAVSAVAALAALAALASLPLRVPEGFFLSLCRSLAEVWATSLRPEAQRVATSRAVDLRSETVPWRLRVPGLPMAGRERRRERLRPGPGESCSCGSGASTSFSPPSSIFPMAAAACAACSTLLMSNIDIRLCIGSTCCSRLTTRRGRALANSSYSSRPFSLLSISFIRCPISVATAPMFRLSMPRPNSSSVRHSSWLVSNSLNASFSVAKRLWMAVATLGRSLATICDGEKTFLGEAAEGAGVLASSTMRPATKSGQETAVLVACDEASSTKARACRKVQSISDCSRALYSPSARRIPVWSLSKASKACRRVPNLVSKASRTNEYLSLSSGSLYFTSRPPFCSSFLSVREDEARRTTWRGSFTVVARF
mmetsp:Transcript_23011/g.53776  ORF Transcript_23011/g.53776 Transcript_23011/m.53776 type:complete len:487 (-) Transcript_23011:3469-4929(-)